MAKELKCIIMELRPAKQSERDKRVYQEAGVKKILFKFARALGCRRC